jgi:transposase-like protein
VGPDRKEHIMTDVAHNNQRARRRRRRQLTAEEKYEIYLALVTGEMTQNEAADRYGVDRSTIARIRTTGKQAVLEALANSRPGRPRSQVDPELKAAQDEVERLGEVVKEQAVELVALRTKSRWG